MNILQLIASNSFITTNKAIIKLFGLIEANIIGLFASMANFNNKDDGWFYITYERIEEELNISKHISSKAIEKLIKNGVLIDKKQGVPCRRFFKFQEDRLFNSLKLNNLTTGNEDVLPPVVKNFNFKELNSLTTSSKDTSRLVVKELNGYNNKYNNTDKNKSFDYQLKEWELFFNTFWEDFKPVADKEGSIGVKGSKTEAKKAFKSLISENESPVYIIWGMKAYLKKIDGKTQNCHAVTFLKQKRYEEFIENEIKNIKEVENQNQIKAEKQTKLVNYSDDPFWIKSKEELINSVPIKWKESVKSFYYGGKDGDINLIITDSKFLRDWFKKEYSTIFNKIFTKWQLIAN